MSFSFFLLFLCSGVQNVVVHLAGVWGAPDHYVVGWLVVYSNIEISTTRYHFSILSAPTCLVPLWLSHSVHRLGRYPRSMGSTTYSTATRLQTTDPLLGVLPKWSVRTPTWSIKTPVHRKHANTRPTRFLAFNHRPLPTRSTTPHHLPCVFSQLSKFLALLLVAEKKIDQARKKKDPKRHGSSNGGFQRRRVHDVRRFCEGRHNPPTTLCDQLFNWATQSAAFREPWCAE